MSDSGRVRKLSEPRTLDTTDRASSGWIAVPGQGVEGAGRVPLLYARAIREARGEPRVFSPFDQLRPNEHVPKELQVTLETDPEDLSPLEGAVGLLLPGGGDIDPILYGERRHPATRRMSRLRDRLETNLLREALRRDMPVLCICRGMQLLNVVLGGTLDQHLADNPELMEHDRDIPRAEPVHTIEIAEGSGFEEVLDGLEAPVNSHHHQGLADVAEGLEAIAHAGDGVLEAVRATHNTWVLGVQWHPEVMAPIEERQMKIFKRFVAATERFAAGRNAA